jgi:hypothetical protein
MIALAVAGLTAACPMLVCVWSDPTPDAKYIAIKTWITVTPPF